VLRSIVVAQQARRLGLGRCLADALTERARSAGAREVYLFTSDAQAFWHHLGFEDVPLDEWPQAPRQGWQYRFIAANQDDPVFREVRGMRKPA
jgi:N-acetylglutamate synthase-like GNAT family acetyltransferase